MNGAYCLVCQEQGPDLAISTNQRVPPGAHGRIEFICGKCGAKWEWSITWTETGPVYSHPRRMDRVQ
jgi:hypothetical protein